MNTHFCQNCVFWNRDHGLEMGRLGPIAPCTRRAPSHYVVESLNWSSFHADQPDGLSVEVDERGHQLQVPMAVWPYTSGRHFCGDYYPCDLDESARRFQHRAAPLI